MQLNIPRYCFKVLSICNSYQTSLGLLFPIGNRLRIPIQSLAQGMLFTDIHCGGLCGGLCKIILCTSIKSYNQTADFKSLFSGTTSTVTSRLPSPLPRFWSLPLGGQRASRRLQSCWQEPRTQCSCQVILKRLRDMKEARLRDQIDQICINYSLKA